MFDVVILEKCSNIQKRMQCLKKREALLSKLAANKFQINSGTFIAMLLFRILATVKNDKK
ncbi:hypothetical protein D932_01983 [Enterococcus casseliflavus 14-MB-W-14]|nr:hypothetical protein D932_01983 [Enterococcus casseliflavus 14-MB-W-14]